MTRINNAESSKPAVPIPVEEPDPESPIKWPLPMLLENKLAPTGIQCIDRRARKNPSTEPRFWNEDLNNKFLFMNRFYSDSLIWSKIRVL